MIAPLRPSALRHTARTTLISLMCASLLAPGWVRAQAEAEGTGAAVLSPTALPALGDAAVQDLSPMAERRLGDRIMRSLLGDPDVIDDPLVLEYVGQIWGRLLAGAKARGEIGPELQASHAWQPFLVKDKSVNAFALPGGYIGVHLGLLAMTTTPDELASVLAHELSHVTQRHIARMIGQQSRQSWVSLASLVLGILAASRAPMAAQAMIYGGQAASIQGQLNFSRDMEREADRLGLELMGGAGFAASGMSAMFEKLDQSSRLNDGGQYPYLRSHPLTSERITEARLRAAGLPPPQGPGDVLHALMQARARVMADGGEVALRRLQAQGAATGTPLEIGRAHV